MSRSLNLSRRGQLLSYLVGFALSIYLTITAYLLVSRHLLGTHMLVALISGLAICQFLVQMIFFLHLGRETRPRWKFVVFWFMVGVVLILVFGSIWIMSNLNYHMNPNQINNYLKSQDSL